MKILQLHSSKMDRIIYIDKSYGGLGILKLKNILKLAKIRSMGKKRGSNVFEAQH